MDTPSNTSAGTYTYTTKGANASTTHGDIVVDSTGSMVASWSLGPGVDGSSEIDVVGSYDDAAGNSHDLELTIPDARRGGTAPLESSAQLCLGARCFPVTGTIRVETLTSFCAAPCTESFAGTVTASATWATGSFTLSMRLREQDVLTINSCEESIFSRWCDGSAC